MTTRTRGRSLFARLVTTHLIVAIGALLVLGIVAERLFQERATDDLTDRLRAEARVAQVAISDRSSPADVQALVRALGRASGARVTVIRGDGVVLADSERDPATLENHRARPEVQAAMAGRTGIAERTSESTGRPYLYLALPPQQGVVVRAALPSAVVAEQRGAVRAGIAVSFLALAVAAVVISTLLARSVSRPLDRISQEVQRVARGEFTAVRPSGPKEARELAAAVNEMSAQLARRVDELAAETTLREQILSAMDEAVILARDGSIRYANPAARRLFGLDRIGALPAPIALPDTNEPATAEFALHHPAYRDVRSVSIPIGDGSVLVVAQDVTESKRIERVRRDFVANASHELKTPVAAMLATAETLQSAINDDPEAAVRFAATMTREAKRMSALVQDLLSLTRMEQWATPTQKPVALAAVVGEVLADLHDRADEKRISVEPVTLEDITVSGSEEDLRSMVRNLVDNAVRYTPDGGRVTVELRALPGEARLIVADTGIGIPARDLPRIFERFYRVDRARSRETGGTGLGLSIVRHVAESHGGTVHAESELERGSTFTVSLPAGTTG